MKAAPQRMTLDEFIAWEIEQPDRYEFVNGEIIGMVGGSYKHNAVINNVAVHFTAHLPKRCQTVSQGMRLTVEDNLFFPDVMVSCSPPEHGARKCPGSRANV